MRNPLLLAAIAALIVVASQPDAWSQSRNTGSQSGGSQNSMFSSSQGAGALSTGGSLIPSGQEFGSGPAMSGGAQPLRSNLEAVREAASATGADWIGGQGPQAFRTGSSTQRGRTSTTQRGRTSTTNRRLQSSALRRGSSYTSSRFGRGTSRYGGSMGEIRAVIRLGFSAPPTAPAQVSTTLATRLKGSSRIQARSPIDVSMEGRTAVLRGAVATDHDRAIAEWLARLEPGVDRVDNQLTIQPSAAEPAKPPAPSS